MLVAGAGVSAYADEAAKDPAVDAKPVCGSIDPGFAHDVEGTLRERGGNADPGFAPRPSDTEPATSGGSIDPGFSRPFDNCSTQRLQDVLAPAAGTPEGAGPTATPSTQQ
jgi:hypothetical protein